MLKIGPCKPRRKLGYLNSNLMLALALAGGGAMRPPPLRFFEASVKTAARSAAKFGTAYGATFLHMT